MMERPKQNAQICKVNSTSTIAKNLSLAIINQDTENVIVSNPIISEIFRGIVKILNFAFAKPNLIAPINTAHNDVIVAEAISIACISSTLYGISCISPVKAALAIRMIAMKATIVINSRITPVAVQAYFWCAFVPSIGTNNSRRPKAFKALKTLNVALFMFICIIPLQYSSKNDVDKELVK